MSPTIWKQRRSTRRCLSLNIRLNGAQAETGAKTLAELCDLLGYDRDTKIATAVNGEFMAKAERRTCQLANGDEVEIVAPRQGG